VCFGRGDKRDILLVCTSVVDGWSVGRFKINELELLNHEFTALKATVRDPFSNGKDGEVVPVILDGDDLEVAKVIDIALVVQEVE
jgi:hypothetical protein